MKLYNSFNQNYRQQTIAVLEIPMNLSSTESQVLSNYTIIIANSALFKTKVFHRIIAKAYSLMWEAYILFYQKFVFLIFVSCILILTNFLFNHMHFTI